MAEDSTLSQLIHRLEKATSKLEDIAFSGKTGSRAGSGQTDLSTDNYSEGKVFGDSKPFEIEAYEKLLEGHLQTFFDLSESIGGLVYQQSNPIKELIEAQLEFLSVVTQCHKPQLTSDAFLQLVKPTQEALEKICEFREKNRSSNFFNHLSTISEGIPAFGWVVVEPSPSSYIKDMRDSAQFYAHRVIKEYKDKDRQHMDWANSFIAVLDDLYNYVEDFHANGLCWNPKGSSLDDYLGLGLSSSEAPPPPPLPEGPLTETPNSRAALLTEINQGENITSRLKKVEKSQMTHKNPTLRASNVVPAKESQESNIPLLEVQKKTIQPAKIERSGNKWFVENQHQNRNVVVQADSIKEAVYISNCTEATIQIKGKCNAITIEKCKQTGILIESAISAIDIVRCTSLQLQVLGKTPTLTIDQTSGIDMFLSKDCCGVEIFSSNSTAMNCSFPNASGEFLEDPIPEQFKTIFVDGKMITEPVEHF